MPLFTRPWQSVVSILKQFRIEEMKEADPYREHQGYMFGYAGGLCNVWSQSWHQVGFRGQEPWRKASLKGLMGAKTWRYGRLGL